MKSSADASDCSLRTRCNKYANRDLCDALEPVEALYRQFGDLHVKLSPAAIADPPAARGLGTEDLRDPARGSLELASAEISVNARSDGAGSRADIRPGIKWFARDREWSLQVVI